MFFNDKLKTVTDSQKKFKAANIHMKKNVVCLNCDNNKGVYPVY